VVFLRRAALTAFKLPAQPLVELGVARSVARCNLVSPPKRADSSRGLWFPTAHTRPGGPHHAGTPARYVPPAGFGDPLGGLLPPSPGRLYFAPAALLGLTLRSLLLPQGIDRVSATDEPTYRFARRYSRPPRRQGRPNRPRFLGFDPCESPWRQAGISSSAAGCSLGFFALLGRATNTWPGISPGLLPRASPKPTLRKTSAGTPEYRSVLISSAMAYPETGNATVNNPYRVLAPVRSGT